jgi:hypothetical protein
MKSAFELPIMSDIFISYTHRDNAKLSDEVHGWVDRFHEALQIRLNTLWGYEAEIWRDFKTQGNDLLTPTIEASVQNSSILISVLSPGYVHSDWCAKELDLFCEAAGKAGGLEVGTQSRIVKVIKTPVGRDAEAVHEALAASIGYPFYRVDERGLPWEFDARSGEEARRHFLNKVNELSYDICSTLEALTGKRSDRGLVAPPSGATVYLAETTSDLTSSCDQLRRELVQHGHRVLPGAPLQHSPTYADAVRDGLAQARISIHPVGKSYGVVPEGYDSSVIALQYQLAGSEVERRPGFVRLPWILPETTPADERVRGFIASLQDDPRLLITTLDNLKSSVKEMLTPKITTRAAQPPAEHKQTISVYFIADTGDEAAAKEYEDLLFSKGCEVIRPLGDAEETERRLDHEESLKSCDSVLVYHGGTTEFWLRTKLRDLQKAFGYGRGRPFLAQAVLLGDPDRPDKRAFRSNAIQVLAGFGGFDPAHVEPFLRELAKSDVEAL